MAITDLTNTVWILNKSLKFEDSGTGNNYNTYHINFTSNNIQYLRFRIDKKTNRIGYNTTADNIEDNFTWVYNTENWSNSKYKIITITGGTAVTSSVLINWLQENAIQQTLTNTTWVFNKNLNITSFFESLGENEDERNYLINFTSNNNNYTKFSLQKSDDSMAYFVNNTYSTCYFRGTWRDIDAAYRKIQITGGSSADNSELILFLQENATQQKSIKTISDVKIHKLPSFDAWKDLYGIIPGIPSYDIPLMAPTVWEKSFARLDSNNKVIGNLVTPFAKIIDSDHEIQNSDNHYILICANNNVTITLPSDLTSFDAGFEIEIVRYHSFTVTIDLNDEHTVNGSKNNFSIDKRYKKIKLTCISRGSKYWISSPIELTANVDYIPSSAKGADNGVASLGEDGKVMPTQVSPKWIEVYDDISLTNEHNHAVLMAMGANIVITIPSITTLDKAFECEIMKWSSDTYTLQIHTEEGVTINGSTEDFYIQNRYESIKLKLVNRTYKYWYLYKFPNNVFNNNTLNSFRIDLQGSLQNNGSFSITGANQTYENILNALESDRFVYCNWNSASTGSISATGSHNFRFYPISTRTANATNLTKRISFMGQIMTGQLALTNYTIMCKENNTWEVIMQPPLISSTLPISNTSYPYTRVLQQSDNGCVLRCDNSGNSQEITIQVPKLSSDGANSTAVFPPYFECEIVNWSGGPVKIEAAADVTINGRTGAIFSVSKQYTSAVLKRMGLSNNNTWLLQGAFS